MVTLGGVYLVPGVYLGPGAVYLVPGGCTWFWGVSAPGGVPGPGEGVPGPGGCTWSRGVYLVPGGVPGPGGCTWSGTPPTVDRHTPVNLLPCPKLRLRAVKMHQSEKYHLLLCNQFLITKNPCRRRPVQMSYLFRLDS